MRPVIAVQKRSGGWRDATCAWTGLELERGGPDDHGMFPAGRLGVLLDNATGEWSQYNLDGSPSEFGPGMAVNVWAHNNDDDWWMFAGKIVRWDERGDDTVEFEAFDVFSDLATVIGTFTPGVAGDRAGARLNSITLAAGRSAVPHRFATGLVTLTAQPTDAAPLEEMQTVALSDGGVIYVDADGTLVFYDRSWRNGRNDQLALVVASDNVCTAPVIVWDAVLSTNDVGLADVVILENVAKLKAQFPATISGTVFSATEQQWTTQDEGDTLANVIQVAQRQPRVAIDSFDLYLNDGNQPYLWQAVDWRLFDVLRFLHNSKVVGGTTLLDVSTLIVSVAHAITPDNWIMTVGTSRALSYIAPILWDNTTIFWDNPSPAAVWSY